MIQTVKKSELARKEYHILPAALMEAMDEGEAKGLARGKSLGLAEGKSLGLAEGKSLGLAEGSRQKALETARLMKQHAYPIVEICLMTGLSQTEVEGLN